MKHAEQKRIVIVDGYSTGRDLVLELLERNVECIHLQSTEHLPAPVATCFDRSPYDGDLGYVGGVATAIEVLSALAPHAVIPGSEWGVTFTEQIAHSMGLPTNRPEMISARRDKFDMIEAIRLRGLRAASQTSVSSAAEAHAWAERHASWPIIVKPMASAGSDGVSICNSHTDIEIAVANTLHRNNFMGCYNDRLLLQSYLSGPQFIVNTVSRDGRHYVTDVWHQPVSIAGSAPVPREIHLLDPRTPTVRSLIAYTLDALDALGIENGAAHSELKWTPKGPALIETGARLMGAAMDRPSYAAADMESQAMVYADMLAGTEQERDALFARRRYALKRHMTKLLFNFQEAAEISSTDGLGRLRSLPSFHAHYRGLAKGDRVQKTADWLCRGGVVYLIHVDPDQIAADIDTIRAWSSAANSMASLRSVNSQPRTPGHEHRAKSHAVRHRAAIGRQGALWHLPRRHLDAAVCAGQRLPDGRGVSGNHAVSTAEACAGPAGASQYLDSDQLHQPFLCAETPAPRHVRFDRNRHVVADRHCAGQRPE